VSGELEIVDERGERVRVPVADRPLLVCGGTLRVVPSERGVRIESPEPGASLRVQGEDRAGVELIHGRGVDIGRVRVTWFDGVVSVDAAGRARGSARSSRSPRSNAWPAVVVTVGVVVLALFVLRGLDGALVLRPPSYYVELAQAQYENNRLERALATLTSVKDDTVGGVRVTALALERRIRRLLRESDAAADVAAARAEHRLLVSFEARYLTTPQRPASRELVRLCDEWSNAHGEVCGWHPDGSSLLAAVAQLRERYAAAAELLQPEDRADVVFAAESRLRFMWRDYKGALVRIDTFLAAHPEEQALRAERSRLLREGREWLEKRLRRVERAVGSGDLDNAARDLVHLERWVAIPEWEAEIAAQRAQLEAQR